MINLLDIKENLQNVKQKIKTACKKVHKNSDLIKLIAVTKNFSVQQINELIFLGEKNIGENIVQEALEKFPLLKGKTLKHFIGHLQSNKVLKACQLFDFIQSIDSLKIAKKVSDTCIKLKKKMPVLIQVNIGREEQKFGLLEEDLNSFLLKACKLKGIQIQGLMAVHPFHEEREKSRIYFWKMNQIFKEVSAKKFPNIKMKFLSMGMSQDFDIAIEEGTNMVRIGTAIFGERKN